MTTSLRRACYDDLPEIKRIALASPWTKHVTHISYCNRTRFALGDVLLAERDERAVGFLIWRRRRTHHDVKIDMIAVDQEAARTGVGQALIDFLRDETGSNIVVLNVSKENERAIGFYERYGFRRGAETRDQTCWQMRFVGRGALF